MLNNYHLMVLDDRKTFIKSITPMNSDDPKVYVETAEIEQRATHMRNAFALTISSLLGSSTERPYERMAGDYQQPVSMPIPNFVTIRMVAQMLTQRAQCYLLMGQPDLALQELTLVHDLCRLLEAKPTGKPMTLVAAMIHVAVA